MLMSGDRLFATINNNLKVYSLSCKSSTPIATYQLRDDDYD